MAPSVPDPYGLERFVAAQHDRFDRVLAELRHGRKTTHWMWFIFPQLAGLGSSPTARTYAISGLEEARAYLQHPLLGARLRRCVQLVVESAEPEAGAFFGYPDELKLRSSLTLFLHASAHEALFQTALDKYFGGTGDERTLQRL